MSLQRFNAKNIQKGEKYEELVAKYFRDEGYIVFKNSLIGQADDGLDLLAFHQNHTLLIQCKNRNSSQEQHKLKKDEIEILIKKLEEIEKLHLFYPYENYELKFVLVISSSCVEKEVFELVKKGQIEIHLLPICDNGEFIDAKKIKIYKKGNLNAFSLKNE